MNRSHPPAAGSPIYAVTLLLAVAAAPLAHAQVGPLGPRRAQLFDREVVSERLTVADPPDTALPDSFQLQRLLPSGPPVLLGGEFDRKGQHVVVVPPNLRDFALVLAADQRFPRGGRAHYPIHYTNATPPLVLAAHFERTRDGTQRVTANLVLDPAHRGDDEPKWSGTIAVDRRLDDDGGLTGFRAHFDLRMRVEADETDRSGVRQLAFDVVEDWRHREILDGDSQEFRARVYRAIVDGGEYVEHQLRDYDGGDMAQEEPNSHGTGSGHLALALLTVLKAGVDPEGETVAAALDELRGREMTNTYCLATALMAFEALYAPAGERDDLLSGRLSAPTQRRPSPEDLALMQEWTKRLLGNIDTGADPAYVRRFHYHPSTSWDNSNSQYAMLGLYAARLCGVEISPQVWYAAARHFVDCQRDESLRHMGVQVLYHQDLVKEGSNGTGTRSTGRRIAPKGWAYQGSGAATGSMTTAGIAGLTLAFAALHQDRKLDRPTFLELDQSLQGGFGWFAQHLTVRTNPTTDHGSHHRWHYYYLYGLERACELNQVATIQGRDWYFEGATYLLEDHFAKERLGGLENTCFAVLFLKKATMPTLTGR